MAKIVTGNRIGAQGSLRLGCSVAIWNESRTHILLMQRSDNGLWCLPSGGMDPGESVSEAAEREVLEETGLTVVAAGVIGIYSSPHELVQYPDGNCFQIVSICLEATVVQGIATRSEEALKVGWFRQADMDQLPIMGNHLSRINDIFSFSGATFLR